MSVQSLYGIMRTSRLKATADTYIRGNPVLISSDPFLQNPRKHALPLKKPSPDQCALPDFFKVLIFLSQDFNLRVNDAVITEGHTGIRLSDQFAKNPLQPISGNRFSHSSSYDDSDL
jgi:hypothetical protein